MGLISWIKELVVLQEFISIPVELINNLREDKPYSKLEAAIDIISMANENGEVPISERSLMKRWGWGNTKVRNFIKYLKNENICKAETKHLNSPQNEHQIISKTDDIQIILDEWNKLSACGIDTITEEHLSHTQFQNIIVLEEKYNIKDILRTIQKVNNSDFLQGKSNYNWKITFDWFVKLDNFSKVSRGKYDNRNGGVNNGASRTVKTYEDRIGEIGIKENKESNPLF